MAVPEEAENGVESERSLETLFQNIDSQESLDRALETLKVAAPNGAGKLVEAVTARHIPVIYNPERQNSAAFKSLYTVLHRDSEAAKRVEIRKGASLLEVVHELAHAVPLREHGGSLSGIEISQPDLKQDDEAIVDALKRIGFLDEAISVVTEIETEKELENFGVTIQDPFVTDEVRKIYAEKGVLGIAERFGELFPNYDDYYGGLARESLPSLKGTAGQLNNMNWGDKLGGFGVDVDMHSEQAKVSIKPKELIRAAERAFAHVSRERIAMGAGIAADKLKEFLQERARERVAREKIAAPEKLAELPLFNLEPKPESREKGTEALEKDPEATGYRVQIAGRMALMIQKASKGYGEQKAIGWVSNASLRRAEQASGMIPPHIYETLRTVLAGDTKREDLHYQEAKELALSMIRNGYEKDGRDVLNYYVDNYASQRENRSIADLTLELIDEGQEDAAFRLFHVIEERLARVEKDYLEEIKKPPHYGELTPKGQQRWDQFFAEREGRHVTEVERNAFFQALYRAGDYTAKRTWRDQILKYKTFSDSNESSYCESLISLVPSAQRFAQAADKLEAKNPAVAQEYRALADRMHSRALFASQLEFDGRIADIGSYYPKAHYDPARGWRAYAAQVENAPNAPKDYNFTRAVTPYETHEVILSLCKSRHSFSSGLEALYHLGPETGKVELFKTLSERLPADLSPEETSRFLTAWEAELQSSLPLLAAAGYIEPGLFDSKQSSDRQKKRDNGERPASYRECHMYAEQRLAMAKVFLRTGNAEDQERGLQMIQELSDSSRDVFNPHEGFAPGQSAFDKTNRAFIDVDLFNPAQFKIYALLESAKSSSGHASGLRQEAFHLLGQIDVDPTKEGVSDVEYKARRFIEGFYAAVEERNLAQAQEIHDRLGGIIIKMRRYYENRVEFLKRPEQELKRLPEFRDEGEFAIFQAQDGAERTLKSLGFWEQHLASSLRTTLATLMIGNGQERAAGDIFTDVQRNIESDIRGRRERFDVRSITQTAAEMAKFPQLESQAVTGFTLAIEKVGLQRGDYEIFKKSLSYFIDKVIESGLSPQKQDEVLRAFVLEIEPPNLSDWQQMSEMIPELVRLSDILSKEGKYPATERELLRMFRDTASAVEFSAQDPYICEKMEAMAKVVGEIQKTHPEIFHSANFPILLGLSEEVQYIQELTALFPEVAREHMGGEIMHDGIFDIAKIKAELHSLDSTLELAGEEIAKIIASPELAAERLEHIMKVFEELGRQDLTAAFAKKKNELSYQEIISLRSSEQLTKILGNKLYDRDTVLTPQDLRVVRALCYAEGREEASKKAPLYLELLDNENVPTEVQRAAFENFLLSGRVGEFISRHFENDIAGAEERVQRKFYSTITELLKIGGDTLSATHERVTSWLFEEPDRSPAILAKFKESYSRPTVQDYQTIGGKTYMLNTHDEREFTTKRKEYISKVPDRES